LNSEGKKRGRSERQNFIKISYNQVKFPLNPLTPQWGGGGGAYPKKCFADLYAPPDLFPGYASEMNRIVTARKTTCRMSYKERKFNRFNGN